MIPRKIDNSVLEESSTRAKWLIIINWSLAARVLKKPLRGDWQRGGEWAVQSYIGMSPDRSAHEDVEANFCDLLTVSSKSEKASAIIPIQSQAGKPVMWVPCSLRTGNANDLDQRGWLCTDSEFQMLMPSIPPSLTSPSIFRDGKVFGQLSRLFCSLIKLTQSQHPLITAGI